MVQMKKVVKPSARHCAGAGVFKVDGRESLLLGVVVGRRTVDYRSLQYGRRYYPNCSMGNNLDQTILLWARISTMPKLWGPFSFHTFGSTTGGDAIFCPTPKIWWMGFGRKNSLPVEMPLERGLSAHGASRFV
jgi:hypothetical protein